MAKAAKKLVLKEIVAKEPLAEVYELSPFCKYIVMLKRSKIALNQNVELEKRGRELLRIFAVYRIPCAVFIGSLDDIQIVELRAEKE